MERREKMDVHKELEWWRTSFSQAKTSEEKEELQGRFQVFLDSLSQEDGKAFAALFKKGRKMAIENAKELIKEIDFKVQPSDILN